MREQPAFYLGDRVVCEFGDGSSTNGVIFTENLMPNRVTIKYDDMSLCDNYVWNGVNFDCVSDTDPDFQKVTIVKRPKESE